MPILASSFTTLSDSDLLVEVSRLAACERHVTAQLIVSLAELDARRLYRGCGISSMFTYCTQALHLSEHAAYNRIEVARTARRFPMILDRLVDGSITLTTVCLLAAHLTPETRAVEAGDDEATADGADGDAWFAACPRNHTPRGLGAR